MREGVFMWWESDGVVMTAGLCTCRWSRGTMLQSENGHEAPTAKREPSGYTEIASARTLQDQTRRLRLLEERDRDCPPLL